MLIVATGIALLCGLGVGYALLLQDKLDIRADFLPILIFSGAVCLLYFSGLAGLLLPSVWLFVAGGLASLLYMVVRGLRRRTLARQLRRLISPGTVVFVLGAMVLLVAMRGSRMFVGDSYNHWATIVKVMYYRNVLPDVTDSIILFQSYPPGSALFLYLGSKLMGFGESRMLWSQALLLLACGSCVFAAAKPDKPLKTSAAVLACLAAVVVMLGQSPVFDLLVDTLLGLAAMAAAVIFLHYRATPAKGILLAAPVMVLCLLTKNSGVLFAAVNTLLFVLIFCKDELHRHRTDRRPADWVRRGAVLAALSLPFMALWLWNIHVDAAYPQGALSIHAMRPERLLDNFQALTRADYAEVFRLLMNYIFSPHNRITVGLLLWNAVFLAAAALGWRHNAKNSRRLLGVLAFADIVFMLYLSGLYATYVTSMTLQEAMNLACIDRYYATVWVYVTGLLTYVLCRAFMGEGQPRRSVFLGVGLAIPLLYGLACTVDYREGFTPRVYEGSFCQRIDQQVGALGINGAPYTYYVIGPTEGILGGTTGSYLKYVLFTNNTLIEITPPSVSYIDEMVRQKATYSVAC